MVSGLRPRDGGRVGFHCNIRLEDMLDERAVPRALHRIADDAGDRMQALTKRATPVSARPHKGRLPGTARDSVERSGVEDFIGPRGRAVRVRVFTFDPVFPYIEWNTVPHDIPNAFGYGPLFGIGGRFEGKFHPGTTGQHPFARASMQVEAELPQLARPALKEFERDLVRAA